jgi:hypothetical protein
VTSRADAAELDDVELARRINDLRQGVEEGIVPLWTGDEPMSAYLERARNQRR